MLCGGGPSGGKGACRWACKWRVCLLTTVYCVWSASFILLDPYDRRFKADRRVVWLCLCLYLTAVVSAGSGLCERVSAVLGSKVAAVLVPIEVKLQEEGVTITG
jgi:hypothetical protein